MRIGFFALVLLAVAGCETIPQDSPELTLDPVIEKPAPGTLELAERAIGEHRFADAKKLLDRVLLAEPDNMKARLVLAELQLASGFPKPAAAVFGALVDDPDVSALALQGLGIASVLNGDTREGYESLSKAVEQDPGLWRAWNALGYYHDTERDWAAADENYDKALAANPGSALILNNRGYSRLMQQRLEEAIEDFNRALAIDRDFELAQENLRLALAWKGKYVHAMAGATHTNMGRILNNIGFIAILRGDYENAESYLLRAMEADPSFNEVASRNLAYLKHVKELRDADSQAANN